MADKSGIIEEKFGTHTARFEPPDLFVVYFIGDVSADDFSQLGNVFRTHSKGKFYALLNVERFESISGKKSVKELPSASGTAIIGATAKMKVVLSLVNKAYMLFNLGKSNPLAFVATEEEGYSWIEHLRSSQ